MAEVCAKAWLLEHGFVDVQVDSAGVQVIPGQPASEFARELCAPHLDNHHSKPLNEELVRSSDIIFGMKSFVHRMFGPVVPPTYFLSFTDNIPDPYGTYVRRDFLARHAPTRPNFL
jgi:protein-tyrosine-phosphatase